MLLCGQSFIVLPFSRLARKPPNGLRYLRWGGDGEAVQPDKTTSVDKA